MPRKTHLGQQTDWNRHKAAIIKAAECGQYGWAAIAAKLCVNIQSIRRKLLEWGAIEKQEEGNANTKRERNAAVIALGKEGLNSQQIVLAMAKQGYEMTSSAVIGVLFRAGIRRKAAVVGEAKQRQLAGASKGMQRILDLELKWENGKRRNQGKPPIQSSLAPIVRDTKSRPQLRIKARREAALAAPIVKPAPRRLMHIERPFVPLEAPPEIVLSAETQSQAGGVLLAERTGCAWPLWGDQRFLDEHRYCNAPRARRKDRFGEVETVSYCAEHWNRAHSGRALKPLNLTKRQLGE